MTLTKVQSEKITQEEQSGKITQEEQMGKITLEGDGAESDTNRSTLSKAMETGFLILTWLAYSTCVEIYGPTLIDLKNRLGTDYEHVAVAVSGRSVGWFPGSIVAGFLVDRFSGYCHLMIAISLDVVAAVTASIPWSPNVTCTWIFCFVGGFFESVINIAGTRILFNMWREKSFSPLMLVHLGYGIGSFIVPLYSNTFLADPVQKSSDTLNPNGTLQIGLILTTSKSSSKTTETLLKDNSRIEYAYAISAAIVTTVSVAFYCYQIHESKKGSGRRTKQNESVKAEAKQRQDRSFKEMINPATCAGGRFCYGLQILFLIFLYFGNIGGGDRMIGSFIRSYSIDQLGFSKDSASFLITSFWITFSVGRLAFAFITRFVSARILIILETGGMALSSILLMIFADDSSLSLWIIIQFFAFFSSATWPTGIAWTDYHIELTGLGMALQIFGASVGGVCHMRLIGYIYENFGPKAFLYQTVGYGVLQFVIAVFLDIIGGQHGRRFSSADRSGEDVEISTNPDTVVARKSNT